VAPVPGIDRVAGEALMILLHLAAALGHIREGDAPAALRALTNLAEAGPAGSGAPYAGEALYWRARLGEVQGERDASRSAAKDYVELLGVLPEGRRRREVQVRLAALTEPGRVLGPEEARAASRRNLESIGLALHAYAADNGGALPDELFDLLGGYVTDASVLVRPGRRAEGGSRIYEYTPRLRADVLKPPRAPAGGGWGVPVMVREPVAVGGERLFLRLDGAVRSVQEKDAGSEDQ
jgi:hypothetical protein